MARVMFALAISVKPWASSTGVYRLPSGESAIAESKLAEKNYPVNVARRAYEQAREAYYASKEGDADRVLLEQRYYAARDQYYAIRARMDK